MSKVKLLSLCIGAFLLAGVPARGQESSWEGVRGTGYGSDRQPPATDDPPGDWTDDESGHDPDEGLDFSGPANYDVQQGPEAEDKAKWAATDYVHWLVNGATLKGKGQAQDQDPADATIVSGEAWGMHEMHVVVSKDEGDYGTIRGENTIYFEWDYLFSGSGVGEASAQLLGNAHDLKGRRHSVAISDHTGEGVEHRRDESSGTSSREYGKLRVRLGTKNGKNASNAEAEAGASEESHDSLEVSITRRLPKASGDSGSTPSVEIQDSVSGKTPLSRYYVVYSDGSATLRARATEVGGALVHLKKFKIHNHLQAWKKAGYDTDNDGLTRDGRGVPDPELKLENPNGPWGDPADVGGAEARPGVEAPHGLDGETGAAAGRLRVRLDRPAPRELVFAIAPASATALLLPDDPRIVIAKGERFGSLPFHGAEAAETTVAYRLLDALGVETGIELLADVATASILAHAAPRLWAAGPGQAGRPGAPVAVRALRGADAGPLRIGRLGYADVATAETVVQIETDDPDGILATLPDSVAIEPGAAETELPLALRDIAGTATIRLSAGAEAIDVFVVSCSQDWRSLPVRVPVGATAPAPFLVSHVERAPRDATASVQDPCLLALERADATLQAGERAWLFRVRGLAAGRTAVSVGSPGLPDLEVPVEVVASWLELVGGVLRLTGLPVAAEGVVTLRAPDGLTFAAIDAPPDAADYLAVEGLGTSEARLVFTPGPDLPASLALPVRFEGDAEPPVELTVAETLFEPGEGGVRNTFTIPVR